MLNNVAIAASYARHVYRHQGIQKVAIVDFDVHHGNGTEAIIASLHPRQEKKRVVTSLFDQITVEKWNYRPWLDDSDSQNVLFLSIHGYTSNFGLFFSWKW